MGVTAENVADKWNITREQDKFAKSQNKAAEAMKQNKLRDEIISGLIEKDNIRSDVTIENLSSLKTILRKWNCNSWKFIRNKRWSAGVIMMRRTAEKRDLDVLAKIVSWATCR